MDAMPNPTRKTSLKERFREELELRGRSRHTIRSYLERVQDLANHFRCSPANLSRDQVREYLLYLVRERKLSPSSVNVANAAITAFFEIVMNRKDFPNLPHIKNVRKKPVVLNAEEIVELLNAAPILKHKVIFMMLYSAGLRVSELVALRVGDVDGGRNQIRVRGGKGRKDRYTILSDISLQYLREYFRAYRPTDFLFYSSRGPHRPMRTRSIWYIINRMRALAGILKPVSPHTLRHSFATHSLENGVSLPQLQMLLGHSDPVTTHQYLHVEKKGLRGLQSPLDNLNYPPPEKRDDSRDAEKSDTGSGGDLSLQPQLSDSSPLPDESGPAKDVPGDRALSDGRSRRTSRKVQRMRRRENIV